MKVALVSTMQPDASYAQYLVGALQAHGIDLHVYADKDQRNLDLPFKNVHLVWDKGPFCFIQVIARALGDNVEIVHLQHELGIYGGFASAILFPFAVLALRLLGKRPVITMHLVPRKRDINEEFLRTFSKPALPLLGSVISYFFSLFYLITSAFARKLIVQSEYMRDTLIRDYHIASSKISVAPIGVDLAQKASAPITREWAGELEHPYALYFGFVNRRKGLEYLLEAWGRLVKEFPNWRLVVAGGTSDYQADYPEQLKVLAAGSGAGQSVVFTGFLRDAEVEETFRKSTFVVLPYVYSIGASFALSFAWRHNKPVIATRTGTFTGDINDGVDGMLVDVRSSRALERAMRRVMSDENLRRNISEAARARAAERAWPKVAQRISEIYSNVCGIRHTI